MPDAAHDRSAGAVGVVIFGRHTADWMAALGPDAPVWRRLPEVAEVCVAEDAADPRLAVTAAPVSGRRTVVIPLMEAHARARPRHLAALAPDGRAVDLLADKRRFAVYARAQRLDGLCPVVYENARVAAFPCVLKRLDLNAGAGVALARSRRHLARLLGAPPWHGHPWVLQSFVPGDTEYVTHLVCDRGRVVWHASLAVATGGRIRTPALTARTEPLPASDATLAHLARFLAPLRYSGPCNIDYKLDRNGSPVVFEINPRLGGSLMVPEHIDLLAHALRCILAHAR